MVPEKVKACVIVYGILAISIYVKFNIQSDQCGIWNIS